jgi:hypothetical protein
MPERRLHDLQVARPPMKLCRESMPQAVYGDRPVDPREVEHESESVLGLPSRQPTSL